jgi:hypothetical protein
LAVAFALDAEPRNDAEPDGPERVFDPHATPQRTWPLVRSPHERPAQSGWHRSVHGGQ